MPPQEPTANVVAIKYFTSPVKASYARHGAESANAQTQYLRALQARNPGLVEVIQGFHIFQPTNLPTYTEDEDPTKTLLTKVWMIEEKQTDVNLALHVYSDVIQGACEQVVICSNDSDIEPALKMIRAHAPHVRIGLVMPLREAVGEDEQVSKVYPNARLTKYADWVRRYIRNDELVQSQLPTNVPTKKKPASKPGHW